ncbi:MAG: hypothetical protein P9L94_03425 [Candidatus Hinthialibacter antarcticus]|nr:hypothetical protein [Candidatus Hinthialibacter antarcticus]
MAPLSREQILQYIKKLETKVKQYQVVLKKRDLEIHSLKTELTKITGRDAEEIVASEAVKETTKQTSAAQDALTQQALQKVKAKTKPLEERSDTFVKKVAPGTDQKIKDAAKAKKTDDFAAAALEAASDSAPEPEKPAEEKEEVKAAPEVFTSSVNFEAGQFLSAVLEGEEEADEIKGLLERLETCEPDQRRAIFTSLTGIYWRMVASFGKRLARESLSWEKRLFMRYGMLDDKLMSDRQEVWERLYLDKSRPEDSGVYFIDEWLEEISRGNIKYSEIDEMSLDGRKPDPNARGEVAIGYELTNVPQMQRMCVGARANQCAILVQDYCAPSRDNPVVNRAWMKDAMKSVLSCDYIMFDRKYKGEEKVVQPFFIVQPGYGQRAGCWEPWSPGKKGTTGPRICICAFPPRNSMKTLLMGIADYRWEWAKADAMHYWLSEGLTGKWLALFSRKEQRKDLKQIFADNYQLWVLFESRRIPKMEKRHREFFYTNCPFNDEVKQRLKGGGVFARMIELEDAKKKRDEEEAKEIERMKAEREARKAKRAAGAG